MEQALVRCMTQCAPPVGSPARFLSNLAMTALFIAATASENNRWVIQGASFTGGTFSMPSKNAENQFIRKVWIRFGGKTGRVHFSVSILLTAFALYITVIKQIC